MAALAFHGVGLFGKIPAQGDFLRGGAGGPAVQAFDRWLEEAIDALRRSGTALADEPCYFVYRASGVRDVLVGALVPSHDAVGRSYPLAAFGIADAAALATCFPLIPTACASFLAAAADLLGQRTLLAGPALVARLGALPAPTPEDGVAAEGTARAILHHTHLGELVARVFQGPPGQHLYAFRTFAMACAPLRGHEAQHPGVTLDCPVRAAVDRVAWLELGRRLLGWHDGPPTVLWADAPSPRLLLSLGPAPAALLDYLTRPDHAGAKLWPVLTERVLAIDEARRALPASHRATLERTEPSLESVLTSLSTP